MKNVFQNLSLKAILIIIGAGIWVLVLQNAGVVPTSQRVRVMNTVDVAGSVDVDNTVQVKGNVDVGDLGVVEVNLRYINGWNAANYYSYKIDGKEFHSLGTE